jgi:hypothetical protein
MGEYYDLRGKVLLLRGLTCTILNSLRSGDNVTAKYYMAALKECYGDFTLRCYHLVFFGKLFGMLGGC